tara:strand:+ start:896 stop:1984 length:1089 start_codon:yes stop_codon:yes gene_type:complete
MKLEDFRNKKVIVTGHTGFKGSWLSTWLSLVGAKVYGFSKNVPTIPSHFDSIKSFFEDDIKGDIRDANAFKNYISKIKPDYLFHLAAQSLVNFSYEEPKLTWETNVIGTVNILDSLRYIDNKCIAIFITSDKCYDNLEWTWGYREIDKLGGPDPYSASKGAAELAISSYFRSYFKKESNISLASARAGNVIGGGDWSLNRLIPDCVKAWANNECVDLRNPFSTRPWQHVLEPIGGYMLLALALSERKELNGESFNFGPNLEKNYNVLDVVNEVSKYWEKIEFNLETEKDKLFYESNLLKLNCDKALHNLNWKACLSFEETISFTARWYKNFYDNPSSIVSTTTDQINEYSQLFSKKILSKNV